MLQFHPLSLEDKPWIDALCAMEQSRSADFSFANMFLWDEKYRQQVCRLEDRLLVLTHSPHGPIFPFPIGGGDPRPALEALVDYSRQKGILCVFRGVESRHLELLESLYPGRFIYCHDRDYDDYLYSAEKLSSLSGKKLHAKRNHVNRFEAAYDWSFRPMCAGDRELCMELLEEWLGSLSPGEEPMDEYRAIARAFEYFEPLGLDGGCLFVGERLAAFTLGDLLCRDTFNVHFEKARRDLDGAYPMINRCFARHIREKYPQLLYINREDDMGLENLRRAKLSYRPELMVEKHSAALR